MFSLEKSCPVCASSPMKVFFELLRIPIYCNLLWPKEDDARNCPRGDIKLAFCDNCGFITNTAFDLNQLNYSQEYENSLHYSARFQEYATSLANQLIERHNLHGKDIIEIGCGKGDFLISLCEQENNRGVGFDPSYVPRSEHARFGEQVQFVQDFYSERYKDYRADLVCCRHTLEHVPDPNDLLRPLRRALGDCANTVAFFEVPNVLDILENLAIWDIIYEHCSYFAPVSLAYAFSMAGFSVCELREAFAGQFLCLEARPSEVRTDLAVEQQAAVQQLANDVAAFTTQFHQKVEVWKQQLAQLECRGQRAVVWGGGSKGVTFLNVLNPQKSIEYVIDINPRKQGMYVAGTGQKIVPPEFLQTLRPDVAIVMNPVYTDEIRQTVQSMGLTLEFLCV